MIKIQGMSGYQVVRYIPDMIEPFMVKRIQKLHHSFFVYRCSDYNSLAHLLNAHKIAFKVKIELRDLIERYWSSIDLIFFKIAELPEYACTKEYFDCMRKIAEEPKTAYDFEIYEVKLTLGIKKPIISACTVCLFRELQSMGKPARIAAVKLSGEACFSFNYSGFDESSYKIETHYGRQGYHLRP